MAVLQPLLATARQVLTAVHPGTLLLITGLALATLLIGVLCPPSNHRRMHPLPPGPPGEPILGHLRIIPASNPEFYYAQVARNLGSDVLHFSMLGQDVIVLNSARAAIELLEKHGANYSDRPRFVLFECMGWRRTLTFLRAGAAFRMHRRILQRSFQKSSIRAYAELQEREALVLLQGLAADPSAWERRLRRFATAVALGIGFGIAIDSDDSPYIRIATDASYALGHGGTPAGTPVDFFPLLRFLPSWLVREHTLRFARNWRWAIRQLHEVPYEAVTATAKPDGTFANSLVAQLLQQRRAQLDAGSTAELEVEDIQGAAGAVYAAGQDTTWATLLVFVLNMVLNPDVQTRAQAAIDAVVPDDRLPSLTDRPRLRTVDLIVQETLRWCPVSPVGVPHRALHDDVYGGFRIPAGAHVYANARAITHDPRMYADPNVFDPDRYRTPDEEPAGRGEPLPVGPFGFGRRVCIGQHLAEASVWIVVASLLKTYTIRKAIDADGGPITPMVELTDGLTSHPKSFPCRFELRSAATRQVIASTVR